MYDVIVVGAGAAGASAAWWLTRQRRSVLLIERFELGHVRGGSHGRSRIFRLAYLERDLIEFAAGSLALWRVLEEDAQRDILTVTGGVDHGDPDVIHAIKRALDGAGQPNELMSAGEASELWDGLRFEDTVLFQPDAGRIDADVAVDAMVRLAAERGAEVHTGERVVALRPGSQDVAVETELRTYRAPVCIVACGSWAPDVLQEHVRLPPITVTVEQPAFFRPTVDTTSWPSFIHRTSAPRAREMYGLASPVEGVKIGQHGGGCTAHPDDRTFDPDPEQLDELCRYVAAWVPGVDPEAIGSTTCLYDTTPQERFVIDRTGPLVVATGFSGHGFKFMPAIGRMLAGLAQGTRSAPELFALPPS